MKKITFIFVFLFIVLVGVIFLVDLDNEIIEAEAPDKNLDFSISAEIIPFKVKIGDIQTTRVKIKDRDGIEKVSAQIPYEGGYDEISLRIVGGSEKNGIWEGQWTAHNTIVKEYTTKITAITRNGEQKIAEANWWDDTETIWYDQNWTQRKKVTLTENSGSTLTNYQVKVTIAYDSDMQADFDDIRFTKSDGATLLDHWLESKTDSTTADFWVEVDSITASTTTDIYYYYGNAGASTTSSVTNTFIREISGVQGSWNMDETSWGTPDCSALVIDDASGNTNDGKACPATTGPTGGATGKFGNAVSFDGNDYLDIGDVASLKITGAISLAGWVKFDNLTPTGGYYQLFGKGRSYSENGDFGYAVGYGSTNNRIDFDTFSTTTRDPATLNSAITDTTNWHYIVVTWDGTTNTNGKKIYIDGGTADLEKTSTISAIGTPAIPFTIGRRGNLSSMYFEGTIDEVSVYNVELTGAEITDLYNNYGYVTTNYPNKVLVRKRASTEPTVGSAGVEEKKSGMPGIGPGSGGFMIF